MSLKVERGKFPLLSTLLPHVKCSNAMAKACCQQALAHTHVPFSAHTLPEQN